MAIQQLSRRSFFTGLGAAIAAPAIVRAASLMPVRAIVVPTGGFMTSDQFYPFHCMLRPSLFEELMNAKAEFAGMSQGELGWWRSIAIKQEMIPA